MNPWGDCGARADFGNAPPVLGIIERTHGAVEFWRAARDVVRVVLARGRRCAFCGAKHWVFVNWRGSTRCWECHERRLALEAAHDTFELKP